MYKHKYIFFLTILLFICTILVPAPASAQGSFFDALCGAIANNINELVIGQEVDQETKQIQISAVKVFLRGDESDWDELVDSTKNWAESSLKTESSKSTQSTTYRNKQQKFVKEVSRIKKDVGKTYYFEGKIGNIDFTMKVPPYEYDTYNSSTKRRGVAYADREAKIFGIYPLNRKASSGNKIKSFFNNILGGTKKDKQYFVILEVFDAKEKSTWPSYMGRSQSGNAFGLFAILINEKTEYLNIFEDAEKIVRFIGGPGKRDVKRNIPDLFIYDLDHDGYDEITLLTNSQGGGGGPYFYLSVYSAKQPPIKKIIKLDILLVRGSGDNIINYREIYFDGYNLYVDGKNIMDYQ